MPTRATASAGLQQRRKQVSRPHQDKGANHLPHRITPYVQNNTGMTRAIAANCRAPDRCPDRRFAARSSGLASGLALAVRPAGSAEVSGAQGRVPEIVSAKRLEMIFGCP